MLDIFTVAFFGHRYIDNPLKVEELLEEQIRKLINEKEYVITNHHSPSGPTINRLLKIKDKINALIVQENIKTAIDSLPG